MSLTTPSNIRELQIKLYRKAKNEPGYRFYWLYDKVYREDILTHAYKLARANKGAPGVDGQSFEEIESTGLETWLTVIREELRNKTYRPQPVRRGKIPKPGGGERPLGIPYIRDRVVQTAVKLLIEPIFEAELEPNTYAYRPKRGANDAIQRVHKLLSSKVMPEPKAEPRKKSAVVRVGTTLVVALIVSDRLNGRKLKFNRRLVPSTS